MRGPDPLLNSAEEESFALPLGVSCCPVAALRGPGSGSASLHGPFWSTCVPSVPSNPCAAHAGASHSPHHSACSLVRVLPCSSMRQTRQQSCRAQKAETKPSPSNAAPPTASIAAPEMAPAVGDPPLAGAFSAPTQQPTPSPGAEAAPPTSRPSQAPGPPKRLKGEVSSEALQSNIKHEVSPELAHKLAPQQKNSAVPVAGETGSVPPGSSDGQGGEQRQPAAAEDSHNEGALLAEGLDASSGAPTCRSATPASVLDPATAGPPLSAAQVMAGVDGPGPVPEAGVLPFKPLPR